MGGDQGPRFRVRSLRKNARFRASGYPPILFSISRLCVNYPRRDLGDCMSIGAELAVLLSIMAAVAASYQTWRIYRRKFCDGTRLRRHQGMHDCLRLKIEASNRGLSDEYSPVAHRLFALQEAFAWLARERPWMPEHEYRAWLNAIDETIKGTSEGAFSNCFEFANALDPAFAKHVRQLLSLESLSQDA